MKYLVLGRKHLVLMAACISITILALTVVLGSLSSIPASTAKKKLPIYSVGRQDKVVSLSFDAAWGNEDTQELIDILGKYNVKVTFFIVGDWVDKFPESVKALSDAGHEIMNHSDSHPHMSKISKEKIMTEINNCNDKIEKITGVRPNLHRAPYGEYDNKLIETLDSMNIYCIQWDVDSLDWKDLTASEIQKRVLSNVRPGSIILFHNAAKHTPESLPGIIEKLQADGYQLVPISENIYTENFILDHEGRQQKIENNLSST